MSQLKMVSPLLDHLIPEKDNGRICLLRSENGEEHFVLKRLSVPASDSQVRALILSGAYADEAAVQEYYGRVVADIRVELDKGKELAASGNFAGALDYQIEPKEEGVGFDVYILYPLYAPLSDYLAASAITNLRAVNLGIDLCDALSTCREAGYLFANVKPENIFLMPSGRFLLGDLGLASVDDLQYTCVPEEYIGAYSAPELSDITVSPNLTVDLYSLGMVLYRIYNGNHGPFEDEHTGEAMADKLRLTGKPLPSPIYADYELAGIILKACSFKKEDRFQTPEEFKQALVLYMQRNEVSDSLIVPPIIAADEPLAAQEAAEEPAEEPMRMTEAEELDDDFRRSFAPNLSGAGTEEDIDPEAPTEEAPEVAQEETEQPTVEEPTDEPSEEVDPDQMDLDSLLASVSEVVGDAPAEETPTEKPPAEPTPVTHDYVDTESAPAKEPETKKGKSKVAPVIAVAVLLLCIGAVLYFLLSWYFIDVSQLNVVACDTQSITVELLSEDEAGLFVLSCTDSYGNAYPGSQDGDRYTFRGLQAKTTYQITVDAAGYHALRNADAYTMSVTTPESTVITSFTAVRGSEDGEVLLTLEHDGPAPSQWKLSCTDGTDSKSYTFEGSSYLVTGLTLNGHYTFTLESTDTVYLTGECTVEYEVLPSVEANDLNVTDISGNAVTVSWTPAENVPSEWTLTCEASGLETITVTCTEPTCTLTLPDFSRDYVFSVSARGMDVPETLTLPADPIVVEELTATPANDGTMVVSWSTPVGAPSGGWYVSYRPVGSLHAAYMQSDATTDRSVTLNGLVPNTEYEITLSLTGSDTGSSLFGHTKLNYTTPEAEAFTAFGTTPKPPYTAASGFISLWEKPTKEKWTYLDLSYTKKTFAANEEAAVCIEVNAVNASTDTVTLLYAVRNSDGNVVNDAFRQLEWDDMWYSRRHVNAVPMPAAQGEDSVPGDYTLEIYVNGKLLASIGFTIA